jgi:hypothetical protein
LRTVWSKITTFAAPVSAHQRLDLGIVDAGHIVLGVEIGGARGTPTQHEALLVQRQFAQQRAGVADGRPARRIADASLRHAWRRRIGIDERLVAVGRKIVERRLDCVEPESSRR